MGYHSLHPGMFSSTSAFCLKARCQEHFVVVITKTSPGIGKYLQEKKIHPGWEMLHQRQRDYLLLTGNRRKTDTVCGCNYSSKADASNSRNLAFFLYFPMITMGLERAMKFKDKLNCKVSSATEADFFIIPLMIFVIFQHLKKIWLMITSSHSS